MIILSCKNFNSKLIRIYLQTLQKYLGLVIKNMDTRMLCFCKWCGSFCCTFFDLYQHWTNGVHATLVKLTLYIFFEKLVKLQKCTSKWDIFVMALTNDLLQKTSGPKSNISYTFMKHMMIWNNIKQAHHSISLGFWFFFDKKKNTIPA